MRAEMKLNVLTSDGLGEIVNLGGLAMANSAVGRY